MVDYTTVPVSMGVRARGRRFRTRRRWVSQRSCRAFFATTHRAPPRARAQTTIMAVKYADGVVLGADSRTSTGTYVANRASDKITPICENVWMCRSGSAADTQNVAAYVSRLAQEHAVSVSSAGADADEGIKCDVKLVANITQKIAYQNKDRLQAGMIIAGYDRKLGPQVYGIPLGGAMMENPFTVGGSGSAYIYGWCDDTFRENMSKEEAQAWVKRAISLAIARDASSGGVIRLVTIDATGVSRQMIQPIEQPLCDEELPAVKRS